ncbi:MAG: hypothetical protein U9Q69_05620 [Nanoarchaeota archaeon]|nr:hypothetical protein [Nanoarchaeota archaeon]
MSIWIDFSYGDDFERWKNDSTIESTFVETYSNSPIGKNLQVSQHKINEDSEAYFLFYLSDRFYQYFTSIKPLLDEGKNVSTIGFLRGLEKCLEEYDCQTNHEKYDLMREIVGKVYSR